MSNYPPGAEYDSSAPYNQEDPEPIRCPKCNERNFFTVKRNKFIFIGKWDEVWVNICRECFTNFDEAGERV